MVTVGAATAAKHPGMVIINPAVPSDTVKPGPMEVSSPIGRISVVTIEKIPIVTESTAAQPAVDERGDVAVPAMDIDSVLWVEKLQWKRIPPNSRYQKICREFPPSSCPPKVDLAHPLPHAPGRRLPLNGPASARTIIMRISLRTSSCSRESAPDFAPRS